MNMNRLTFTILQYLLWLLFAVYPLNAQQPDMIPEPVKYEIASLHIKGVKFLETNVLANLSGLSVGKKIEIPGDDIAKAIKKYWKQGLFSDVKIVADSIIGTKAYLSIHLTERARLGEFSFNGLRKGEEKDIIEKIEIKKGLQVTEDLLNKIRYIIRNHFIEKGFLDVTVEFDQHIDPATPNKVKLTIVVDRKERVKIKEVEIEGNNAFTDKRVERSMKKTKEKALRNFFRTKKFNEKEFEADKEKLIAFYNKRGYRDARITADSTRHISSKRMIVYITVFEGQKYYFRNITWVGNTKYTTMQLSKALGIKSGDLYDQEMLEKRLYNAEDAVTSLYLDNGYLFSNIDPVEVSNINDSIDIEMRVYEGRQARIDEVAVIGNTKTYEHVVRRELRNRPGDLFSKRDIIRSVRELAQLGHFDPENIEPTPIPNQANGTVDLNFNLTEKANDQLELSGGWGAGMFVGTLGLRFNNFSARNLLKGKAWRPVPSGDGQSLALRAQTNGRYYQAYSITFIEPWLGGKKPNSLSVSFYHTIRNNSNFFTNESNKWMKISGVSVGIGRRLKWPDDYFTLYNEASFQNYNLRDWYGYFLYSNGHSNNLSFTTSLGRNSTDQPVFPRTGSQFTLSLQMTPPYSLINGRDYTVLSDAEKYKWIEYHKWKYKSSWFITLVGNLVLHTKGEFGYLAYYNRDIGPSPFEGFDVGGDGLSGYSIYGIEPIGLRGYANSSLTPVVNNSRSGNIYDKFTFEFRFPFVLKPAATVFGLAFVEAGNCWFDFTTFNPYDFKRSAGVGLRAMLPMFGLLGVDWGYGFDEIPGQPGANRSQFHFVIGQPF